MYENWMNLDAVARERRREMQRQAEQERLVRQLLATGRPATRPAATVMAWLGRRLVNWGERLQARGSQPRPIARFTP